MHPEDRGLQFELVQQKGVDVGLAFHMVRSFYKRRWAKLVLCSGDGDFHEPVQSLIETEGVDLYLVGARRAISSELLPYAKKIFELDQEPILSAIRQEKPEVCCPKLLLCQGLSCCFANLLGRGRFQSIDGHPGWIRRSRGRE
jgi:hypothetical protein